MIQKPDSGRPDPPWPLSVPSRQVILLMLVAVVVACLWLWWAIRDPQVAFLSSRGSAQWIIYPYSPRAGMRSGVELDARFQRWFTLQRIPAEATLSVRAFRRCEISINGEPVPLSNEHGDNWKRARNLEVGKYLHSGKNTIVVTVHNNRGPPALWLTMSNGERAIETDRSWSVSLAGAVWQRARLASAPVDAARIDPDVLLNRPLDSLLARRWTLLLFALISAALVLGVEVTSRGLRARRGADPATADRRLVSVLVALLVLLWVVMFLNNAPSLWRGDGYDAEGHLEYVQFILDHEELPRPNQGWSMFQPPLYYAISAGWFKLAGISTLDLPASYLLRLQSAVFGIAQLLLVFGSLRLVFPDQARKQVVGLILAAFVPVQLYVFQFVGNDALAATLASAGIYMGLRVLRKDRASLLAYAALGVCLGAAMLAKFSVLIVVVVLTMVLAGRLAVEQRGAREWLRTIGMMVLTCVTVCGWHFAGVWRQFGNPFVGNWDPRVIPAWWQDPGYLTASFYLRFGQSLSVPLFSAYNSFADGIYSTLWGDGLISGRTQVGWAPPWNHELMAAGYLLALVPTLAIAVGAVASLVSFVRRPSGAWFVLMGLAAATGFALVVWPLRIPIYSVIKASFGMPAVLSLCALGAVGFDLLLRRWALLRWLVLVALCTWAMNAYATFWIPRESAVARARLGWLYASEMHLRGALEADPRNAVARLGMARLLRNLGRADDAAEELGRLLSERPDHPRGHLELARLLASQGQAEEAIRHYRQVLQLRPDDAEAQFSLGKLLRSKGDSREAIHRFRQALRIAPDQGDVHYNLGVSLSNANELDDALRHFRAAVRMGPDSPPAMSRLAWILATHPSADLRQPEEAVRLAERAAELTKYREAVVLDTLAAAYAAASDFERAVSAAQAALALAAAGEDRMLEGEIRLRLDLYERQEPYLQPGVRSHIPTSERF